MTMNKEPDVLATLDKIMALSIRSCQSPTLLDGTPRITVTAERQAVKDGILTFLTTTAEDAEVRSYQMKLGGQQPEFLQLASIDKPLGMFSGTEVSLEVSGDCDLLVRHVQTYLDRLAILSPKTLIEVHLVGFDQTPDDEDDMNANSFDNDDSAVEKICYDQAAHLPIQASNVERLTFGVGWSRRMEYERGDSRVLYFHDFAPDEIPPSIFKGFEKVEWSKYGCVLAGFAQLGPGEAVLEIKGPSKEKAPQVFSSFYQTKIRASIPDLATSVFSMVKGSSNGDFRLECIRIMGLNGVEDLTEIFEATLTSRLNDIVGRLGHRAPAASRRQMHRSGARRGSSPGDEHVDDEGQDNSSETQNEEVTMETEEEGNAQMEADRSGTIWDFL
ncbi:hypothetical protein KFL_000800160 [Klebsormidium nitens]|uniref:Uncharacterized protein n=1 Tax=Klebsormidium nitens TaxID=105231 RepID=A0A1Y1I003_KLENI|nr:hypothetical protein KFL_000800160 [Klebsormidium nitens]|eukprot:GAQ81438.1 hypothetical protein KFL_000800160 [Klebsormidium nitens]